MTKTKSANPVTVGVFVVGATILAMIVLMVFGASRLFTRTETAVCYFHDGVHGLDVGAPVKYKGVTIGKVDSISIEVSKRDIRDTRIAVIMSVDLNAVKRKVSGADDDKTLFYKQINEGLRAQLAFQSIVTGMLYIELDYFALPGEHFNLYGTSGLHEIPVAPSGLSDLAKKFEETLLQISELDLKSISKNLNLFLVTANEKLEAVDVKAINNKLVATLDNLNQITSDPELKSIAKNTNLFLAEGRNFIAASSTTVDTLGKDTTEAISTLNGILKNLDEIVAPNSPLRYEFSLLLKNLGDTSISIKTLADYLERNPSSILTGRPIRSNENKK